MIFNWHKIATIFFILLLFTSLFILNGTGFGHNSPDEHAAYLASLKISQGELPVFIEPRNLDYMGAIHPRSMIALGERVVPIAFLGLPILYGSFAYIFGAWSIYLMTPLIFISSIFAIFALSKAYFKDIKVAYLTAFIYATHPAMWFYAGRSLMHNVLFNSMLIFAGYFLWLQPIKGKFTWANPVLGGIALSLSLQARLFEIIWVAPLFIIASLIIIAKNNWLKNIILSIISALIVALPFLYLQHNLYGHWSATGYNPIPYEFSIPDNFIIQENTSETSIDNNSFLPFGLHPRAALRHTWHYLLWLFPWLTILAGIGLFAFLADTQNKKQHLAFLAISCLASIFLLLIYGSWTFHDNPDPNAITIANSYIRYWIPLFTLSSFLIGYAIHKLALLSGYYKITASLFLLLSLTFSISTVFTGPDGLLTTRRNLLSYADDKELILQNTNQDSIIILDFADKYIYPHRSVIVPLRNDRTYALLPNLVANEDLYYFGITLPPRDIEFFNQVRLQDTNYIINPLISIREKTLYNFIEIE